MGKVNIKLIHLFKGLYSRTILLQKL